MTTLKSAVIEYLVPSPKYADATGWKERHIQALNSSGLPWVIVNMFASLYDYANWHERKYGSPISDDGVLGAAWFDMLRGLRRLLNGELGGLDGGTMGAGICALAKDAGFDEEL